MNDQWAILELMGHVRTAGRVTEEEKFGVKMGRIDIPVLDGTFVTQYFGGASVYRMTLVDEAAARAVAISSGVHPVQSWEMPRPEPLQLQSAEKPEEGRDWRYHNMDKDSDGSDY